MSNPLATYRHLLAGRAVEAKAGFGWLLAIQKQSLPWVAVIAVAISAAWLGLPFWLTVSLWALAFAGWLFVNVAMISGIIRAKDDLNG